MRFTWWEAIVRRCSTATSCSTRADRGDAGTGIAKELATDRPSLTYEIEVGHEGPGYAALFDLDGTVVQGFSALALLRDRLMGGHLQLRDLANMGLGALEYRESQAGFSALMTAMARALRGTPERDLVEAGRRVFREQLAASIYPDVRHLVHAHRERGHTVAIMTAATRYQAEPIARDLGIRNVVCTKLEVDDGVLTGRVKGPISYADGKRAAAVAFARRRRIDLGKSYFYTDGFEDVPLLEAVGYPRPTNPDRHLARYAEERGWSSHHFERVEPASATDVLRTLALTTLLPGATGVAALASRLGGGAASLMSRSIQGFGALASALGGVELNVIGEENLDYTPAVFVFNHASAIDLLLMARVVPQPAAALLRGRGESLWVRALGSVYAGAVVLEPMLSTSRSALSEAIELIHDGVSLVSAPEDAPTPTPRLAPFRNAPFRVAMETHAPIIPVVIHNSQDLLPAGALSLRSGVVEVDVLQPISTAGWTPKSLSREVRKVHQLIGRVLDERRLEL